MEGGRERGGKIERSHVREDQRENVEKYRTEEMRSYTDPRKGDAAKVHDEREGRGVTSAHVIGKRRVLLKCPRDVCMQGSLVTCAYEEHGEGQVLRSSVRVLGVSGACIYIRSG